MSRIPPPDPHGRILAYLDGGIKASFSRWDWPGLSMSYSAKTGQHCYINRSSAVKFLQEHGASIQWHSLSRVILTEIEKLCPAASKAEQISQAKLGALVRGHQVRKRTVLPARVRQFLDKRFVVNSPSKGETSQMAILICRQINEKLAEKGNAGKSFFITSLKGHARLDYPLEKGEELKKSSPLDLKVDLWMTISKDGKAVSLQFKPESACLLGEGSYRKVFEAEDIEVGMQPTKSKEGYSRETTKTPSVRVSGVGDQLSSSSSYKMVKRGAEVHKASFSKLAEAKKKGLLPGVYLTSPHETLGASVEKQVRYGTDMEKLVKTGNLSQDFSPDAKKIQVTRVQLLQCARDVALALKWLNDQGITHRDVKVWNVNISWGKDKDGTERPIAYLADFDFASQGFGYDSLAFEYDYYAWDPCCALANITTPYTDLYGAAQIFCQVMAPSLNWKNFDVAKKAIQRDVEAGKPFQPERYIPQELEEHQKEAFAFFCGICYESSLLLKELKQRRGFPMSIGPEQVQAAMVTLKKKGLLQHSVDGLIALIDQEVARLS